MTDDALFKRWLEVNMHVRHWERLLSERMTTTMWAVMACIGAVVLLVATQGLELASSRRMVAALMAFAAIPAAVGYFLVLSAQRQLQHHRDARDVLGPRVNFGLTRIESSCLHRAMGLAAIVMFVYGFVAGAYGLLFLPQSYFDRVEPLPPMRLSIDGLPAVVESTDRLARSFEHFSGASGPFVVRGLDELTQSVERLAAAQHSDPGATRSVNVDGLPVLTEAIGRLVDRMAGSMSPPPLAVIPRTEGGKPERIPFEAVAENPNGMTAWAVAGSAAVLAMAGVIGAVFMRGPPAIRVLVATTSLALGITGTLPLSFSGEFNLKGDLSCGSGGCIRFERGGTVLRELAATPSFGIGASESTDQLKACVNLEENDADAWKKWRKEVVQAWLTRPSPKSTDIVLVRGSADPHPLSGPLRQRHETNSGLALARAEHVAGLLQDATARDPRGEHRLDRTRVLALAAGPAGTGGPASTTSRAHACVDLTRQDQRRVRVWIQETPS